MPEHSGISRTAETRAVATEPGGDSEGAKSVPSKRMRF
jgi:hypothetical protein